MVEFVLCMYVVVWVGWGADVGITIMQIQYLFLHIVMICMQDYGLIIIIMCACYAFMLVCRLYVGMGVGGGSGMDGPLLVPIYAGGDVHHVCV